MCDTYFLSIYRLRVAAGLARIALLEDRFRDALTSLKIEDDVANLPFLYEKLFSHECSIFLLKKYKDICDEMASLRFCECDKHFEFLMFIQEVLATALWKFGLSVGGDLEQFARDFDRLDVQEERLRLFKSVGGNV